MGVPLQIAFKGTRPYLQSADIFNALVAVTGAKQDFLLKFTSMLSTPIEAVPAGEVEAPNKAPARFRALGPEGEIDLVIRPAGHVGSLERVPYDEDAVTCQSVIVDRAISCDNGASATPLERMVALHKRLIHEVLKPGKKLLFTSVSLSHLPVGPNLRIELQANLGTKLFRSAVSSDGERLGEIVFYGV